MRLTAPARGIILQLVLGAAAIALLAWRSDLGRALEALPHLSTAPAFGGLLLFTASKAVHSVRWRLLLRHHPEVPGRDLLALFLVSNFVNALLPLRAGDLVRIELPRRRYGIPRAELLTNVVVVESVLDGVAFVLLLLAALASTNVAPIVRPGLLLIGVAILGTFAAVVGAARSNRLRGLLLRAPLRERPRIARRVGEALDGMAALADASVALTLVLLSLTGWILEVAAYWLLARAFGLHLGVGAALAVTVVANLVVAIPLTPWNIGPYELVLTGLLVLLGVGRTPATVYAVGSHVLLMLWIGVTGLLAMWSLHIDARTLRLAGRVARQK